MKTKMFKLGSEKLGIELRVELDNASAAERKQIEALRGELLRIFTRLSDMRSHLYTTLCALYVSIIGREKFDNYRLRVDVRTMKARLEMAQAALNRNEMPDMAKINEDVNRRLRMYHRSVDEKKRQIREWSRSTPVSKFDMDEAHALYRTIVRRLHPDLHPEQSEELKDLFISGVAAYHNFDLNALRSLVLLIDMEIDNDRDALKDETPAETIDRLQQQIDSLNEEIERLKKKFPFNIEQQLDDPVWVHQQKEAVRAEREKLEAQLKIYTERLDVIIR